MTNTTIQRLKLYNSASQVIIVQLVMEWAYPQARRLLDSFPRRYAKLFYPLFDFYYILYSLSFFDFYVQFQTELRGRLF